MTKPWTEPELEQEWQYIYNERLAMLGCYNDPDPDQHNMAKNNADQAVAKLRETHDQR